MAVIINLVGKVVCVTRKKSIYKSLLGEIKVGLIGRKKMKAPIEPFTLFIFKLVKFSSKCSFLPQIQVHALEGEDNLMVKSKKPREFPWLSVVKKPWFSVGGRSSMDPLVPSQEIKI